jgi:hypothetical protein
VFVNIFLFQARPEIKLYSQKNKNRLKKKLLRRAKYTRGTTQITENRHSGSDKPLPLTRETENPDKKLLGFSTRK